MTQCRVKQAKTLQAGAQSMSSAAEEPEVAEFGGIVAERLAALSTSADCTLRSRDGKEVRVHRVKLIEQSSVLR